MAKLQLKVGSTSVDVNVFIQDSSLSTGAGLTGLVFNSGSLTGYYHRQGAAAAVAITLATKTVGTWATGGFVAVDGTNMPGTYELGIPDAALAAGARWVIIMLKGAANMAPMVLEIELTAVDNQSANAFMTGVNSVAPPTNWNLMSIDASGRIDLGKWIGSAPLGLNNQLVQADVQRVLNAVVNTALAQLGVNVVSQANIDFGALQKTSLNAATPASIVGSVGSVTGAVTIADGQILVKRNTALNDFPFTITSSVTHLPTAGLTVTGTRSIDGGAFAPLANAVVEIGGGWYSVDFAASDLNGTTVAVQLEAVGADDRDFTIVTQE